MRALTFVLPWLVLSACPAASTTQIMVVCSTASSSSPELRLATRDAHRYLRALKCGGIAGAACTALVFVPTLQDCVNLTHTNDVVVVDVRDKVLAVPALVDAAFPLQNEGTQAPFANILRSLDGDSHVVHVLNRSSTSGRTVVCSGATPRATLYSVYALAGQLGARFYLHGDVLPTPDASLSLAHVRPELSTPRFLARGLQVHFASMPGFDATFLQNEHTNSPAAPQFSPSMISRWVRTGGMQHSSRRQPPRWQSSASTCGASTRTPSEEQSHSSGWDLPRRVAMQLCIPCRLGCRSVCLAGL